MTLDEAKRNGAEQAIKYTIVGIFIIYLAFAAMVIYVSGAGLGDGLLWVTASGPGVLFPLIAAIIGASLTAWLLGREAGKKIFHKINSWKWVGIITGLGIHIVASIMAIVSVIIYDKTAVDFGLHPVNELPEKDYVSVIVLLIAMAVGLLPSGLLGWFFGKSLMKKQLEKEQLQ